ncbi:hypothetical protein SDC9_174222 [bioreactor metagenome]|uniref:Uncharacterized protein n=1 Tax=bioreactor metagenome TaxID=1076179 RepID=A0A645GIT4_9ZZZZ
MGQVADGRNERPAGGGKLIVPQCCSGWKSHRNVGGEGDQPTSTGYRVHEGAESYDRAEQPENAHEGSSSL